MDDVTPSSKGSALKTTFAEVVKAVAIGIDVNEEDEDEDNESDLLFASLVKKLLFKSSFLESGVGKFEAIGATTRDRLLPIVFIPSLIPDFCDLNLVYILDRIEL